MKLAWLCYDDDDYYPRVIIRFEEPESWEYKRVVQIVYTEILNQDQTMNYRIARKILTCKSTLHTNPIAVHRAKKHLIELHRGKYIESPSGNTYFILE